MIIGVCGFAGSGKGTVADLLIEQHGFSKVSFADKLKDVVADLFGVPRSLLEGDTDISRHFREQPIPDEWIRELRVDQPAWIASLGDHQITWRWLLQFIGSEVMRSAFHPHIWIVTTKLEITKRLEFRPNIVIPDLRFTNEEIAIRELGGYVWSVVRPDNYAENYTKRNQLHVSETGWLNILPDVTIANDGTIDDLRLTVTRTLEGYK